jgi:hypothetical protein
MATFSLSTFGLGEIRLINGRARQLVLLLRTLTDLIRGRESKKLSGVSWITLDRN